MNIPTFDELTRKYNITEPNRVQKAIDFATTMTDYDEALTLLIITHDEHTKAFRNSNLTKLMESPLANYILKNLQDHPIFVQLHGCPVYIENIKNMDD
jgi:hypothetical protein